jgi:succinate dehydrogenase/fumarate reductase cytochrome b subunit
MVKKKFESRLLKQAKVIFFLALALIFGIGIYYTLNNIGSIEAVRSRGLGPSRMMYNGHVYLILDAVLLLVGLFILKKK